MISYTEFLKMTPEQQAPHAAQFTKLNETAAVVNAEADLRRQAQKEAQARLEARWKLECFPKCKECHGEGVLHYEPNHLSSHHDYDMECGDCEGKGYTEVPFGDWLDAVSEDDPDFIAYQENY